MEKCIPGNLVGHGKTLWEVRRHRALRRAQVLPMSHLCCLSHAHRANVVFIAQVSHCMRSIVDLTYITIWAIVRLLRIESLQRASRIPPRVVTCGYQLSPLPLRDEHIAPISSSLQHLYQLHPQLN
jgi:hypothetical protein